MFNAVQMLSVGNTGMSSCQILTHIGIDHILCGLFSIKLIVKLMFGGHWPDNGKWSSDAEKLIMKVIQAPASTNIES
jgi:hypothetical protein